jgi:hypothetical protein
MYPWCYPHASESSTTQAALYAVGDIVYSGRERGTVVTVDADKATMGVVWEDSDDGKPITYPMDADYLSKEFPW